MPEIIDVPATKNPGQRSISVSDAYLARFLPAWNMPPTVDANAWRAIVNAQPIASTCRDTLISGILSLDWKISVRDSKLQDELSATVKYYTRLFEKAGYGSDLDYTSHVEWIGGDVLDTPFGAASEIGRKGDTPNGRVLWIEPLDAGTLYPTLNHEYPVVQYYNGAQVAFPRHAISRAYMRPRTRIEWKGWGIAPPETAYLALNMLARGDTYYANLLLDIPTTGILDLGDMEKESALEWVDAYKMLLANGGNSSFKIPVLYEHQNDIKFVPFGKVPNDIMFDRITLKYAALVTAAYGMTLSDIGIQVTASGGETLAGSIRSERKTRKTGFARLKKKLKFYFDQILPPTLQFNWVDYDDEVNVALGRARLANATAFKSLKDAGFISAGEGRQQLMADGMFTISMPEEPPAPPKEPVKTIQRPGILGNPVPASTGGQGEVRKSYVEQLDFQPVRGLIAELIAETYGELLEIRDEVGEDHLYEAREKIEQSLGDVGRYKADWLSLPNVDKSVTEIVEGTVEKVALKELSRMILSENDGIDFTQPSDYDTVLNTVSNSIKAQFDEIVDAALETYAELQENK